MNKIIILILPMLFSATFSSGQFSGFKQKVKEQVNKTPEENPTSKSGKMKVISVEEFAENLYSDEDRLLKTDQGQMILKGTYKKEYTDRINFSGFYYLNTFAYIEPSNHFSRDTTKAFSGFSIEYSPEEHTMQIHWDKATANYAMVPEHHHASADKGNVLFQMGMQGGPEAWYNAMCLVLEPGVILIGANVYHKNDQTGHQWMNDIQPESFVIAARDTAKFNEYQANPEYTSKVVFEKFDALRRIWQQQEIAEAKPLPAEGMKNATLKQESLQLIKRTAEGYKWKETVEYSYITSTDWEIKKHPLTGATLKRIAKCIVVMKTPKGDYKREGFYIAQDYIGGGNFGKTYMLYNDQRIYYVNPADALKYK